MNVYLTAIGCRLNEAELQSWSRELRSAGHCVVGSVEEAELVVFNTCAVTQEAARKSRKLASRLHRHNPAARMVLTGCYAELEPETTAELAGVDLVINNHDKAWLLDVLQSELDLRRVAPPRSSVPTPQPAPRNGARTRAFVKVQDGCRNRCTFCIVTVARGEERSRPIGEVVHEINELQREGFNEVVLTGVHLGGYGGDLGSSLIELLDGVLEKTEIPRVRISSLEPWDVDHEIFSRWQDPRLGRHLHLPLQSGSDRILRRMARRCDRAGYIELAEAARRAIPDLTLTTDVIVGFPGETDDDWRDTLELCQQMQFAHIHIFSYSPRHGTAAARMEGAVSQDLKRERSRELHRLAGEMKLACLERYVGQSREVLWEGDDLQLVDGRRRWSGLSDNYLRCELTAPAELDLENKLMMVRLVGVEHDHLIAEIDDAWLLRERQALA